MKIKFWGVRGSVPTGINISAINHVLECKSKHPEDVVCLGGNTLCVSLELDDSIIIFDAGTGICNLGKEISKKKLCKKKIYILFSHTHMDHIYGLQFLGQFWNKAISIRIGGAHKGLRTKLKNFFHKDFWPIDLDYFPATKQFLFFREGKKYKFDDYTLEVLELPHPGLSFAYKITSKSKSVVYATDCEIDDDYIKSNRDRLLSYLKDADLMIFDTYFSKEDFPKYRTFGHSTLETGIKLSKLAGIRNLAMFHYNSNYSDTEIQMMHRNAAEKLDTYPEKLILSYEGLKLNL